MCCTCVAIAQPRSVEQFSSGSCPVGLPPAHPVRGWWPWTGMRNGWRRVAFFSEVEMCVLITAFLCLDFPGRGSGSWGSWLRRGLTRDPDG